jgi:P pilus assembly chaperone PapD
MKKIILSLAISTTIAFALSPAPLKLDLTDKKFETLKVNNEKSEVIKVETNVYKWTQDSTGKTIMEPSNLINIKPKITKILPKKVKKIRFINFKKIKAPLAFRVIVKELPKPMIGFNIKEGSAGAKIQVLQALSLPLFLNMTEGDKVELVSVNGRTVRIKNPETDKYIKISQIKINGRIVPLLQYILPGNTADIKLLENTDKIIILYANGKQQELSL